MKRITLTLLLGSLMTIGVLSMQCTGSDSNAEPANKTSVVFFSGGAIDDFIVHMLMLSMEEVDLKGVVLTNADTIDSFAMDAHWKIASLCQRTDVPIALSQARGWNPFPYEYRQDAIAFSAIKALQGYAPNPDWPPYPEGDSLTQTILGEALDAGKTVTLLVTCPITALKLILEQFPELESAIEKVIFMAGAVEVPGNLDPNTIPEPIANPDAEWNIFWDPVGTDWIFTNTTFEIIQFPLDVTNQAHVTQAFRDALAAQGQTFPWSEVAFEGYRLTLDEPFYCLWNSAAACFLGRPDVYHQPVPTQLSVVTDGYRQGAMQKMASGRKVQVVYDFADLPAFYDYFLTLLKR